MSIEIKGWLCPEEGIGGPRDRCGDGDDVPLVSLADVVAELRTKGRWFESTKIGGESTEHVQLAIADEFYAFADHLEALIKEAGK